MNGKPCRRGSAGGDEAPFSRWKNERMRELQRMEKKAMADSEKTADSSKQVRLMDSKQGGKGQYWKRGGIGHESHPCSD